MTSMQNGISRITVNVTATIVFVIDIGNDGFLYHVIEEHRIEIVRSNGVLFKLYQIQMFNIISLCFFTSIFQFENISFY